MEKYDILIKGGHVIDPANKINAPMDVAIVGDKIVKVAPNIPAECGTTVADATGCYVTPGLVDIHTHVYPLLPVGSEETLATIDADAHMIKAGVTTTVDAGTIGWRDYGFFKENVIDKAKVRILTWINVARKGMVDLRSEQDPREHDYLLAAAAAKTFADNIVGIKAAHYWTSYHGPNDDAHPAYASTDNAIKAADIAGLPVMIDFGQNGTTQTYPGLLKRLRPGDFHTHVFAPQFPVINAETGKLYDHMWEARNRGILFDLGHGGGSFVFRNAVPALEQGFYPDTISTDLHMENIHGPVLSMLHTVGKYLNMGMSLEECIARSTYIPARLINRPELGTLSVGACADVAVIKKIDGDFDYIDVRKTKIKGTSELECRLTVRAGEVLYDGYGCTMPVWRDAPESYFKPRTPFIL